VLSAWTRNEFFDVANSDIDNTLFVSEFQKNQQEMEEIEDAVANYVVVTGLKSQKEVDQTKTDIAAEDEMMKTANDNVISSLGLSSSGTFASDFIQFVTRMEGHADMALKTSEELKSHMENL
jgi:hypothetical protein